MKNHLLEKLHPNLTRGNPVKHFQNPQKPNRKKVTGLLRSRVEKLKKNSSCVVKLWSNNGQTNYSRILVLLNNSDQRGAARLLPFGLSPLFPYGPIRPIYSPANSRNSPVLRKIPESLGTFPMSEYSRPIYRSLRLDHFETPRHVPDLIRDSELLRYINIHKLIIKLSS